MGTNGKKLGELYSRDLFSPEQHMRLRPSTSKFSQNLQQTTRARKTSKRRDTR